MNTYSAFVTKGGRTLGNRRSLNRSLRRQGVESSRQQRKAAKAARRIAKA